MLGVSCLALVVSLGSAAPPDAEVLPLKRLRLYETGVGYFERLGRVARGNATSLPVPASHLDDALKTLVVLSAEGQLQVGGIAFESSVSPGMGRALAGLPQAEDGALGFQEILSSLEGLDVSVRTQKERVSGRLVEVLGPYTQQLSAQVDRDGKALAKPPHPVEPEYTLVLRTDQGGIRRLRTHDVIDVQPVQPAARARLDVALDALSERAAQAERSLKVQLSGSGALKLGYIAEIPVWRTTYRVVLDAKGSTLQAWALIHNDTDESWRKVSVELVNGQPTSFLFPLAAPRYARRELAAPEVELSTVPQLLGTTADRLWGDFIGEAYGSGGLGARGHGSGGGGYGSGSAGIGSIGTIGRGGGVGEPSIGDLALFAQATGEESQSLFVYKLATPVNLDAHHSALVPVLSRRVDAEPITWCASDMQVLSAARLLNDTGQTLPAGTVAFFDAGGFAGESGFDRLKPGEQTFPVYGVDLDVDVQRDKRQVDEELLRVTRVNETLVQSLIQVSEIDVVIDNRSGLDRSVYVVLPLQRNAKVQGHDRLDFDHIRKLPLAAFAVPARGKLEQQLSTREAATHSYTFAELSAATLRSLATSKQLRPGQKERLLRAAKLKQQLTRSVIGAGVDSTRELEIKAELSRLRDNLKALGSAGINNDSTRELSARVVQREDKLEQLAREQRTAAQEQERLNKEIQKTLKQL